MATTINGRVLELVLGDITAQEVDAIVNAANRRWPAAAEWTARFTVPVARPSWKKLAVDIPTAAQRVPR